MVDDPWKYLEQFVDREKVDAEWKRINEDAEDEAATEDYPPKPSRFWTYSHDSWDPRWWHKLGVPYMGSDEWGRRTVVAGFGRLGYLVVVLWTCWCEDCHQARAQTYGFAKPALDEHALQRDIRELEEMDRGQ